MMILKISKNLNTHFCILNLTAMYQRILATKRSQSEMETYNVLIFPYGLFGSLEREKSRGE